MNEKEPFFPGTSSFLNKYSLKCKGSYCFASKSNTKKHYYMHVWAQIYTVNKGGNKIWMLKILFFLYWQLPESDTNCSFFTRSKKGDLLSSPVILSGEIITFGKHFKHNLSLLEKKRGLTSIVVRKSLRQVQKGWWEAWIGLSEAEEGCFSKF